MWTICYGFIGCLPFNVCSFVLIPLNIFVNVNDLGFQTLYVVNGFRKMSMFFHNGIVDRNELSVHYSYCMFTHHIGHSERGALHGIQIVPHSCCASQWWWFNIHCLLFFIFISFFFFVTPVFVVVVVVIWSAHQIPFTFHSNALIIYCKHCHFFATIHYTRCMT